MDLTSYTVAAYISVGPDAMFKFDPTGPIALVDEFAVDSTDPHNAAEAVWAVGNKMNPDSDGKDYPRDVRSLCVGDLLIVKSADTVSFMVVSSCGFEEIAEPANRIVTLAGQFNHISRVSS
jgi:hypothetical protein